MKPQMRVELRQGETLLMSLFGQLDPAMPEVNNPRRFIETNKSSLFELAERGLNLFFVIFEEFWVNQINSDLHIQ